MKGKNEDILSSMDKIQGFCGTFKLRLQHMANGSTVVFPTACSLAAGNKLIYVTEEHLKMSPNYF
jgi:hypothetical protein